MCKICSKLTKGVSVVNFEHEITGWDTVQISGWLQSPVYFCFFLIKCIFRTNQCVRANNKRMIRKSSRVLSQVVYDLHHIMKVFSFTYSYAYIYPRMKHFVSRKRIDFLIISTGEVDSIHILFVSHRAVFLRHKNWESGRRSFGRHFCIAKKIFVFKKVNCRPLVHT